MLMVAVSRLCVKAAIEWYNNSMIDKEDGAMVIRITGITLSLASAVVMFIKPFELVLNILVVYFLLILAAILVMVGQLITIRLNLPGDFKSKVKRQDAMYDVVTIGFVMVLFVIFYVIPYVSNNT